MKTIFLLAYFIFANCPSDAQLVHCRPKICMLDYNLHDDSAPNPDMDTIQRVRPDILIDNTPGGYWGEKNKGKGCLPVKYTSLGIRVYSYITSGYQGNKYGTAEDNLDSNLARVDAIAKDSATGVFMDEDSSYVDSASKAYISAIYNECRAKGLQLILNIGVDNFDPWLMSHCNYIMTDEHYDGVRLPTAWESPYLDSILVVAQGITTPATAATISLGARSHGFGYSYVCDTYTALPTWLTVYTTLITQQPATPVITNSGNILHSNAVTGNQWYEVTSGLLAGATSQNDTVSTGSYFDIVTLSGCSSDTSNVITILPTRIEPAGEKKATVIYPNPAYDQFSINISGTDNEELTVAVYNMVGCLLKQLPLYKNNQPISAGDLSTGVYIVTVKSKDRVTEQRLIILK